MLFYNFFRRQQVEERIGNVILRLDDYCGKDLYSEGPAEDELLKLVKEHKEEEYNRLIAESGSWSMLYHLSDLREAVADFLDIEKNETVLEVGSGCGAVTGAFAKKAEWVTCVDLSKKRSLINAWRHRELSNLEILLGNFRDVEKHLTRKYDVISLIGVLEYAGSYMECEDPYREMLRLLKTHLKEGGRIIVAIENKYGLKYFAGCREDHTGGFYDGIKGYPDCDSVRTFSREGLKKMADDLNLGIFFYYPYPDYKLPVTVFSDERLPLVSEPVNGKRNFDYDRFTAFDEAAVFDELIREGDFPFFSNSFIAVMKDGEGLRSMPSLKTIYSRHSMERRRDRRIRTDLKVDENGEKLIVKYPCDEECTAHLENTARAYEKLSTVFAGTRFKPNRVKRINDGEGRLKRLDFEFIKGPTLAEELNTCRAEGRREDMLFLIRSYCETLRSLKDNISFEETAGFREIFGNHSFDRDCLCMAVTDADLIFSNIISAGGWNVIDYEWTFDFPVPLDFVIYRAVFYYLKESGADKELEECLFKEVGIDGEKKTVFSKMEHSFQLYIKGDRITLPEMYSIMGREDLRLERAVNTAALTRGAKKAKLYFDLGEGFNENDVLYIDTVIDDESMVSFETTVPAGCRCLRIDPMDSPCILKLYEAKNGTGKSGVLTNGLLFGQNTIIFNTDDPQLILEKTEPGQSLSVSYRISMLPGDMFADIAGVLSEGRKASGFGLKKNKKGYVRLG